MKDDITPIEDVPEAPSMTIDSLKKHPMWAQLTDKQAIFVAKFIETENRCVSARTAFDVSSDKAAEGMANRLLRTYLVRKLLSVYYGYDIQGSALTRAELIALISNRLRNPDITGSEFKSLTDQLMELNNWRKTPVKGSPGRPRKKFEDYEDEDEDDTPNDNTDVFALVQKLEQQSKK